MGGSIELGKSLDLKRIYGEALILDNFTTQYVQFGSKHWHGGDDGYILSHCLTYFKILVSDCLSIDMLVAPFLSD